MEHPLELSCKDRYKNLQQSLHVQRMMCLSTSYHPASSAHTPQQVWMHVIGPHFLSCFALWSKQIRPGLLPLATQTIHPPDDRRHCTQPMPPFCLQRLRSAIESCTVQRSKLPMKRCKAHQSHITVNRPGEIRIGARLLLPHRHHLCTQMEGPKGCTWHALQDQRAHAPLLWWQL